MSTKLALLVNPQPPSGKTSLRLKLRVPLRSGIVKPKVQPTINTYTKPKIQPSINTYTMRALNRTAFDDLRRLGRILFVDLKIEVENEYEEDPPVIVEFRNRLSLNQMKTLIATNMNANGLTMWKTINHSHLFYMEPKGDTDKSVEY